MRDMTIPRQGGDVAVFKPEETKEKISASDAGIEKTQAHGNRTANAVSGTGRLRSVA